MKLLKKKCCIQIIVVVLIVLIFVVGLIGYGFCDGINLYCLFSQMVFELFVLGEVFCFGGLVEEGMLQWGVGEIVSFCVMDGGVLVLVWFIGVLLDLFVESQGMIGMGCMEGEIFVVSEILVKYDENYMLCEVIDLLKVQGVYEDFNL